MSEICSGSKRGPRDETNNGCTNHHDKARDPNVKHGTKVRTVTKFRTKTLNDQPAKVTCSVPMCAQPRIGFRYTGMVRGPTSTTMVRVGLRVHGKCTCQRREGDGGVLSPKRAANLSCIPYRYDVASGCGCGARTDLLGAGTRHLRVDPGLRPIGCTHHRVRALNQGPPHEIKPRTVTELLGSATGQRP